MKYGGTPGFSSQTSHTSRRAAVMRRVFLAQLAVLLLCTFPQRGHAAGWPRPTRTLITGATIKVNGVYDGKMVRVAGKKGTGTGGEGQEEGQDPIFILSSGSTLQNVVIGKPAANGVHCMGSCTLRNVWWEDVGEDAATMKNSKPTDVMTIDGGGAREAQDKVFQHNGAGTFVIKNFQYVNCHRGYQSCGNCPKQYQRNVVFQNITATNVGTLAVVNQNYRDTAKFSDVTIIGSKKPTICQRNIGNDKQKPPGKVGNGPDGKVCQYSASAIRYSS